jgi:signal peptidase II
MGSTSTVNTRQTPRVVLALLAMAVFVADQLTKGLVERHIPEHAVVPVIPGFFNLINSKNPGAVFGMFAESASPWRTPLLIGVSAALLIVLVGMVWKARRLKWISSIGFALIFAFDTANAVPIK